MYQVKQYTTSKTVKTIVHMTLSEKKKNGRNQVDLFSLKKRIGLVIKWKLDKPNQVLIIEVVYSLKNCPLR